MVYRWKTLLDMGLLETNGEGLFRITQDGIRTIEATEKTGREPKFTPEYLAGKEAGIAETHKAVHEMLNKIMPTGDDLDRPIEDHLMLIRHQLDEAKNHLVNREGALNNRDGVDRLVCQLLGFAVGINATHSERKGMILMVIELLRQYVGQRNGTDAPVHIPESEIPF